MKITQIELTPFEPPFVSGKEYVMSVGSQSILSHSLLKITTDSGLTGTGEVARFYTTSTEEYKQAETQALSELTDFDLTNLQTLLADWRQRGMSTRGVSFALDYAWHDLLSQMTGQPLSVLLGGPPNGDVPEILSLSAGPIENTLAGIRADEGVTPIIQIKLGIDDLETDMACVREVLAILGKDQQVLADFNGALAVDAALTTLPKLSHPGLIWEDPCKSYEDNLKVDRSLSSPLMFDMCFVDLTIFARAIVDGVKLVCIKPARLGGVAVAGTARDMCAAAGLKVRIDGSWSGQCCAHATLSLAIGVPADLVIGSIDQSSLIDTNSEMIIRPSPGRIGLA